MRSVLTTIAVFTLLAPSGVLGEITVRELGDHVLVATGGTWNSNLVAVTTPDGIVIVDTHDTPASTAEALREIRARLPNRPVKYVINTHGHDDHVWGNEVFAGVPIIAHPATFAYMSERQRELAPFFSAQRVTDLRADLESSSASAEEVKEELRRRLESAKQAHDKWGRVKITLPTLTLNEGASLRLGERVIDIIHIGAAHSEGDLAVHVPGEGVLIVGDLIGAPRTLVRLDGEQGDVVGLATALANLGAEYGDSIRYLVAGHGPVGDANWLDASRSYIEYVLEEVQAARARGWNLEQSKKRLVLDKLHDFAEFSDLRENNIEAAWISLERRQAGNHAH